MNQNDGSISHHPDEATLMAYAAGALTEGFNLVVAAHLEFCADCCSRVTEAEAIGGELLQELPGSPAPAGCPAARRRRAL